MKVNIPPDGQEHTFDNPEVAETIKTTFIDGISFETVFYRHHEQVLHIIHEIMPNGYLRIITQHIANH